MSFETLVDGSTGVTRSAELERFSNLDDKSRGVLSGYTTFTSTQKEGAGVRPISPAIGPTKRGQRRTINQTRRLARRDAIRRGLLKAKDTAESMEIYAKNEDQMELSLAGFKLREVLDDLWKLRFEREDDWGDLLNILQGALTQEEFEIFSSEQCYAIHTVIADHLGSGAVGIDDIEETVKLLRKAGFDPWKGISGPLHSDED